MYKLTFHQTMKNGYVKDLGGIFDTAKDAVMAVDCVETTLHLFTSRMGREEINSFVQSINETGQAARKSRRWQITTIHEEGE